MKEKKVIKQRSIQLSIDFPSDVKCISEDNFITKNNYTNTITYNKTIVIDIRDCKKIIEENRSKKAIEYILNNAKRF